ncbi:hypothetical protein GQ53DRAFT_186544 [Thozetella sp. PMI_491]|nr:hypothetical protein GQ53DRAFT_186544 [Thozetella sp. PMI_491]
MLLDEVWLSEMATLVRIRRQFTRLHHSIFPRVPTEPPRPPLQEPGVELPEHPVLREAAEDVNQAPVEAPQAPVEAPQAPVEAPQAPVEGPARDVGGRETQRLPQHGLAAAQVGQRKRTKNENGHAPGPTAVASTSRTDETEAGPSTSKAATLIQHANVDVNIYPVIHDAIVKSFPSLDKSKVLYISSVETPPELKEMYEDVSERIDIDLEAQGKKAEINANPRTTPSSIYIDTIAMCGYANPKDDRVQLRPTIVIRLKKEDACKVIYKAVKTMEWLELEFPELEVTVVQSGVRLGSDLGPEDVLGLDLTRGIRIAPDVLLYINVEDWQDKTSACGLICCATIKHGSDIRHRLCRIGGVVTSGNGAESAQFGVSTAHAMLNNSWWLKELVRHQVNLGHKLPPGLATWAEVGDGDDDYDDAPLAINPVEVTRWRNVTDWATLSFLGQVVHTQTKTKSTRPLFPADPKNSTDHALMSFESRSAAASASPPRLVNSYYPAQLRDSEDAHPVELVSYDTDPKVAEGPVQIVCGDRNIVSGYLVFGTATFGFAGQAFRLRKIFLDEDKPLGMLQPFPWLS